MDRVLLQAISVLRGLERLLGRPRSLSAELGPEPKAARTRIVHVQAGAEGLDLVCLTDPSCVPS
ncbi:hypothetical protein [Streptomyces sp. NPDC002172]